MTAGTNTFHYFWYCIVASFGNIQQYLPSHHISSVPGYVPSNSPLLEQPQLPKIDLHAVIDANPLLAALLLGASLGLSPKPAAPNHPELLPINPYVALLLSQYGRYVPLHGSARGIYGYAAANNFHNNKPFGAYKVYEETKRR